MKDKIKGLIRKITPSKLINTFNEPLQRQLQDQQLYRSQTLEYANLSYAQEGEDILLERILKGKKNGFYVDVGAHHPKRFSNTYYFYKQGWKGINIDAMPGSMDLFKTMREGDINLEIPVSHKEEKLIYYAFNEPALNGFSKQLSDSRNGVNNYHIIFEKELTTQPLSAILDQYLPPLQHIDFLSIDVEGLDLQVLKSNNWDKYRPSLILIEDLQRLSYERIGEGEVYQFLKNQQYELFAKTFNTLFFKASNELPE